MYPGTIRLETYIRAGSLSLRAGVHTNLGRLLEGLRRAFPNPLNRDSVISNLVGQLKEVLKGESLTETSLSLLLRGLKEARKALEAHPLDKRRAAVVELIREVEKALITRTAQAVERDRPATTDKPKHPAEANTHATPSLPIERINTPTPTVTINQKFVAAKESEVNPRRALETLPPLSHESSTARSEMLGWQLLATITRIFQESSHSRTSSAEATRHSVARFNREIEQLNQFLERLKITVKVKADKAIRKESTEQPQGQRTSSSSQHSNGTDTLVCEIIYNEKGEVVGFEITGHLKEANLTDGIRELAGRRSAEGLLDLIDLAAAQVDRQNMTSQQARELLREIFPTAGHGLINANGELITLPTQVLAIGELTTKAANAPRPEAEAVLNVTAAPREQVHDPLQVTPAQDPERSTRPDNQQNPAVTNLTTRALVRQLAQSEQTWQLVVNTFARGEEAALMSTEIGQALVLETAKNIVASTAQVNKSSELANKNLINQPAAQQIATVAKQTVFANRLKFTKQALNLTGAKALFSVVAKTGQCLELFRETAPKPRLAETATKVKELQRSSQDNRLTISQDVRNQLFAGLAAAHIIPDQAPPAPQGSLPQESRGASTLKRIVEVLEQQLKAGQSDSKPAAPQVRRGKRVAAPAASPVTPMDQGEQAELLPPDAKLLGIILQLANGEGESFEQIVKALKLDNRFKPLTQAIENKNLEGVLAFLDNFRIQVNKIRNGQILSPEILEAALEIIKDELEKRENDIVDIRQGVVVRRAKELLSA
ncbi:hypothetical protein COT42_07640 [Candidatus Saganbacteria bacterium CG08_land_8_20_14_0_20_45_16]|uniref:Uncharacterized protein n=1 Tax=Candidatus Saganbacteria bacterium CG08_land_8_20_14_0_20_45_16 TaxID=2014293 RepID=A0A2H0XWP4_UNCSA|nr:MAG: hypothetical protein COT42_07640 [Candidatus Saganbacteria bacterium CG08_land_8_20_14_0_20_45_16]